MQMMPATGALTFCGKRQTGTLWGYPPCGQGFRPYPKGGKAAFPAVFCLLPQWVTMVSGAEVGNGIGTILQYLNDIP